MLYLIHLNMTIWVAKIFYINIYGTYYSWRFLLHGGIDGFTRMIVYLTCSKDNKAATVTQEVDEFGLPSTVRSDKGVENIDIAWYMLNHPDQGSHITAWRVHNQRIERMWCDLFAGCTYLYYPLFCFMEDSVLLDPSNEIHMAALHYVYKPRINASLGLFKIGHNQRPISTERNLSPEQL